MTNLAGYRDAPAGATITAMLAQDEISLMRVLRTLVAAFPDPLGNAELARPARAPAAYVSILLQDLAEAGTVLRSKEGGSAFPGHPKSFAFARPRALRALTQPVRLPAGSKRS